MEGFSGDAKYDFLTEEQMKEKPGYVYDIENEKPNMCEVPSMLDNIATVLEYMSEDEPMATKERDYAEYTALMESKFPVFSDEYFSVFQQLITGKDLTPMFGMLAMIERIQNNEVSFEDGEKMVGEQLAKTFVLPVINKDKK